MFVFEIITPGTWLDYEDRDWTWRVEGLIRNLESQFFEANLALNLFTHARSVNSNSFDHDTWERDSQRRSEIRKIIEEEFSRNVSPQFQTDFQFNNWDEIHFETEVRFKKEKWSEGRIPREFEHNLPFIYARAFLYALDAFDKFLGVLAKEENAPKEIATLHAQMTKDFPDLRGVRNTTQHLEDRSRGLGAGKNPQPLALKPVSNSLIHAPNGALILNSLMNSKYGSTMSDGHYGEIDVSPQSMQHLQKILQEVLQSFKWSGSKRHSPGLS
jgi:hypothetical protein